MIPLFKNDEIEINYLSEGKGEPLVFVHGTNTKLEAWNFQINYFKDKMNIIALDNRGCGKSSRPNYPYTMEMFVEDLKNLLDSLEITQKIHLCGCSLGGMIALTFTLKYPEKVKSLTLIGTPAYIEPMGREQRHTFYKDFVNLKIEQRIQTILPNLYSRAFRKKLKNDENLFNLIKNDMNFIVYYRDTPTYEDYINQNAAMNDYDVRESIDKIGQPTLILAGDKDLLTPLAETQIVHEKMPNSSMKVFNGLGHGIAIEAADEVNELMWNFIKEHLG
ncbi:MAG: alpha/beta fold hydrolase [Candidatus Hermodarchaeota archaeon]